MGKRKKEKKKKRQHEETLQQLEAQWLKKRRAADTTEASAGTVGSELQDEPADDSMDAVSDSDLHAAERVLTTFVGNPAMLSKPRFRNLRKLLHPLVDLQAQKVETGGLGTTGSAGPRRVGTTEPEEKTREKLKARDRELINSRVLRAARLKRLEEMCDKGKDEEDARTRVYRVPDGEPSLRFLRSDEIALDARS